MAEDLNCNRSRRLRVAASYDSIFEGGRRRPPAPSISPLVAWDDSALDDKYYNTFSVKTDELQEEMHMGVVAQRMLNTRVFDEAYTEASAQSRPESVDESDSEDEFLEKRFRDPVQYFQELDELGARIYEGSVLPTLMEGTLYKPFNGRIVFVAPFLKNAPFQYSTNDEIMEFCNDVAIRANEDGADTGLGPHYVDQRMHHRHIAKLVDLIESRNVISAVWHNVTEMKKADYCGDFISMLVLDSTRPEVAKLVRIECDMIEQLANAFELCLCQLKEYDPASVLLDAISTLEEEVSSKSRQVLIKLNMDVSGLRSQDIWRCVVHILDGAVLSYMGAHTQFFGSEFITSVALPGCSQEPQYFRFCRRKFSCINEFLRGKEAWVLERYHADILHDDKPPLWLSTDAMTFGDIWGPMWKTCVIGHEQKILQYCVGNGTIVPWTTSSLVLSDAVTIRKDEVFCHWISDRENSSQDFRSSLSLQDNDTLLIGAPIKFHVNAKCKASAADHRQRLRNSGSLSEPGTVKRSRVLDVETVQVQVTPPYMTLGYQMQWKKQFQSMKDAVMEKWKNSPASRHPSCLEFKLGLEVSACTYNARRRRLIQLFGTKTMLNHLRNISLRWESAECRSGFFSALQNPDHTAFRKLYKSNPTWQEDFGNAIQCCFDILTSTGKSEEELVLFWAPDDEPGEKVTLKSSELSWIGFLEDTRTSGALAVLEDNCLELPSLEIGRKCLRQGFDSRYKKGSTGIFDGPVLQTSIQINGSCAPSSIRKGRIPSRRYDGKTPEYPYRWCLLSLEEGDKFDFGDNGNLKVITELTQGQLLAKWSGSWDVKRRLKTISFNVPVLGRMVDAATLAFHEECIRHRKENTSPVAVLILDTNHTVLQSSRLSRRLSNLDKSFTLDSSPRSRHSSIVAMPRSEANTANASLSPELRSIIERWKLKHRNASQLAVPEWEQ